MTLCWPELDHILELSLQAENGGGAPEGRGLKPNAGEGTAAGPELWSGGADREQGGRVRGDEAGVQTSE